MTDLRSPAAAAFEVDGGVVRWAQATCTPVNTIASRTANCSGGLFLRLRAIALGLRGPPTVRQFKDSARCRAGASRTAATGPLRAKYLWYTLGLFHKEIAFMARCEICNKGPIYGHRISHAHNLTKRRWNPNLQRVRVIVGKTHKSMRVCTNCIRSGRVNKA